MTASRADIGLWFALVFPSSFVVLKYFGWESAIAYAIVVAMIVAFRPRPMDRLSDRGVLWLAILTIAFVAAAYALVFLASPLVVLGTSALRNLFWLPVFFVVISKGSDSRTALSLAWLIFALSPVVMYEVVTGTGYVSNTIYVLLGLWWLMRTEHRAVAAIGWA